MPFVKGQEPDRQLNPSQVAKGFHNGRREVPEKRNALGDDSTETEAAEEGAISAASSTSKAAANGGLSKSARPVRKEKLAINLYDLERYDKVLSHRLVLDKVDTQFPEWIDKNSKEETILVFQCDLLTAATVCDVLRSEDRRHQRTPIRLYLLRGRVWSKVPRNAVLTSELNVAERTDESPYLALNPKYFPEEVQLAPAKPPPFRRLI